MCARGTLDWNNFVELLSQLRHQRVIVICAAHVNQTCGLLLDRGHNFGMAMTGRTHGDAGVTVKKNVAVNVFYPNALGTFGDELERRARVGWIYELGICLYDATGFGTGQRSFDLWSFRGYGGCHHLFAPEKRLRVRHDQTVSDQTKQG